MEESKRPPFLSALCVLTFIGSGTAFIGYFIAAAFFKQVGEFIVKYSSWNSVDEISPVYFIILMVLNAVSLIGAIRIWKFHKPGLYIYVAAQVAILFFPVIWLGWIGFSMTNMVFTLIFITGYLFHIKFLK